MQIDVQKGVTFVKDWFGLIAVVMAVAAAIGFGVSTPWPARADVEKLEQIVRDTQTELKGLSCLTLKLLLRSYQDDLERANDDLAKNPNSVSAQRAKATAEQNIKDVLAQMRETKCAAT